MSANKKESGTGPEQPEFVTISQVARRLQVSPQTVRRWISEGVLRAVRIRKEWRVYSHELDRLLAQAPSPAPEGQTDGWQPTRGHDSMIVADD
jgi:excisionase family DNA binding protein